MDRIDELLYDCNTNFRTEHERIFGLSGKDRQDGLEAALAATRLALLRIVPKEYDPGEPEDDEQTVRGSATPSAGAAQSGDQQPSQPGAPLGNSEPPSHTSGSTPIVLPFSPRFRHKVDERCPHPRHFGMFARKGHAKMGSTLLPCCRADCPSCFAFRKRIHFEHYAQMFGEVYDAGGAIYQAICTPACWDAIRKATRRAGGQLLGIHRPDGDIDLYLTEAVVPDARLLSLEVALTALKASLANAPVPAAGQRLVRSSRGWTINTRDRGVSEWELVCKANHADVDHLLAVAEEYGVPAQRGAGRMTVMWTLPADWPLDQRAVFLRAMSVRKLSNQHGSKRDQSQPGQNQSEGDFDHDLREAG